MVKKAQKIQVLALLSGQEQPLKLAEILQYVSDIPERTLRRWLSAWCDEGLVVKVGKGRATSYQYQHTIEQTPSFAFLQDLDNDLQTIALHQIRDLWTHHSTALEGNTLSLGDTYFILSEGLTISGKPLKDHQEIIGQYPYVRWAVGD